MPLKHIAVVAAGLSQPSSTRLLADRLAEATVRSLAEHGDQVEVTVVELRDLAHDITDNLLTGFPSPELDAAITAVTSADGVIAVTPVFSASYSGLFKSFFDVIDKDSLSGTPVLIGATAGTARHSMVLDFALRPLFSYLRAVVAPLGVFAASEDWGSGDETTTTLPDRVARAGAQFADLVSGHSTARDDAFDGVVPFEEQLRRLSADS
ncbi:FMN reductase [Frondihabitans sp. VKM Ac-2883]|uniref:FMN reductase n=1 Tax=Frondihabitans sp. VKM Ac-2883 TaxID=2783823 RepID=UPI00188AC4C2|nr:FMN reductase [Frondihabitans sp. VKM Ac-2883]MBF4576411.1 FMN reductase [Frondihabitans sp. VKM Ac-2883]